MIILNDMQFTIPEASLDFQSDVMGRSSDIIHDNGKFLDFEKKFPVRMFKEADRTIAAQLRDVVKWLYVGHDYSPLAFSEYAEYFYKAVCYATVTAEDKKREWLDIEFTFKCQPFIFRLDGESERDIPSGQRINNPELFPSQPLITFYKTTAASDSNIYISNGSTNKQFRIAKEAGIGTITLDCENGIAYKEGGVNVSKYCFLNTDGYNPITLEPGFSTFTFSNITNFKIKPRWRTIAV
ncbi:phage tail protein [Enterococcus sp. AZ103]|uniref:phage tail protein n=1 Tax=Enterococcus sp. AZ103 TaxID=2774628 RepID=UPI003F259F26